ncbi:hypothetical protein, partial [Paraglaciecola polaris]
NVFNNVKKEEDGVHFSVVDVDKFIKFIKFILAIYWRAATSTHESYKGAVMHRDLLSKNGDEKLRLCLFNDTKIPSLLFSVKIRRLKDSTGTWSLSDLKNLIVTPFHHPYGEDKKVQVDFVFEGFYFSVISPALSDKERRSDMILYPKGRQFVAKYIDFNSVPELNEIINATVIKVSNGHSSITS